MKKTSAFKKGFRVAGVVVIIILAYLFLDQRMAISEMESACALAVPGDPVEEVIGRLNAKGHVPIRYKAEKEVVIVHTSRAFGRFSCLIEHKDERVTSARLAILN